MILFYEQIITRTSFTYSLLCLLWHSLCHSLHPRAEWTQGGDPAVQQLPISGPVRALQGGQVYTDEAPLVVEGESRVWRIGRDTISYRWESSHFVNTRCGWGGNTTEGDEVLSPPGKCYLPIIMSIHIELIKYGIYIIIFSPSAAPSLFLHPLLLFVSLPSPAPQLCPVWCRLYCRSCDIFGGGSLRGTGLFVRAVVDAGEGEERVPEM